MIPASAPDGRAKNNLQVSFKLPSRLFFRHRFTSQDELNTALASNPIILDGLILSKTPLESRD